jgi:hypothetical protein
MQIANTTEKQTENENMESNKNNWTLGEIATLPKQEKPLKQGGSKAYVHYITSRYICIREATEGQRGILVKVLGKVCGDQVGFVKGEPFCKDDHDELFAGHRYYSFPFPSAKDVREAIDIIRGDQELLQKFEAASMHINPNSTFWVSDIKCRVHSGTDPFVHLKQSPQITQSCGEFLFNHALQFYRIHAHIPDSINIDGIGIFVVVMYQLE